MKRPLRRADSFFGLHFDFHAQETDRAIGTRRAFAAELDELLRRTRPDFVQCDTKGHAGWTSYPTKVGHPAPGVKGDILKIWRRVTAKHGVALYTHHSGVYDTRAVKLHPSWASIDAKGKRNKDKTSVFGPYADKLLIPQLREMREVYGVDGFWIDGENWGTEIDYCPEVIKAFREKTGIRTVPKKPGDPHFFEYLEFCREGFRRYLRHYVDEIHRLCPGAQLTSNWAFSGSMPEPVTANLDFLSGDFPPNDSIQWSRLDARYFMMQGKPWDLMSWSFASVGEHGRFVTKPVVQTLREAATTIAVGGAFQSYFVQRRDGSIRMEHLGIMEQLAKFCRARQRFCHRAESVPQVALLHSGVAFYRISPAVFRPWGGERDAVCGTLSLLLNNQYHVDVVSEHHLTGRLRRYPVIVVPETPYLTASFRRELIAYVRGGGKLLVLGVKPLPFFAKELGVKIVGKPVEKMRSFEAGGELGGVYSPGLNLKPGRGTHVLSRWHEGDDIESPAHPFVVSRRVGRGEIVALAANFGVPYRIHRTSQARNLVGALLRRLFPAPVATIEGSHLVDVSVMKKDGRLMVNLLNTSGPHEDNWRATFDEITPLGPLTVTLRLKKRPAHIRLQPGGKRLPFRWSPGRATVIVPRLEIHSILEVS